MAPMVKSYAWDTFFNCNIISYLIDARSKEEWRGKLITPRTIRRECNSIQYIFEVAKKRWGFENLQNPFRGIEIKGDDSMHAIPLNAAMTCTRLRCFRHM